MDNVTHSYLVAYEPHDWTGFAYTIGVINFICATHGKLLWSSPL